MTLTPKRRPSNGIAQSSHTHAHAYALCSASAWTGNRCSGLPEVDDTLVLDGYTQPGANPNTLAIGDNAVLNIVLDGSLAGSVDGLVIGAGSSTVRGLVIDNFAEGHTLATRRCAGVLVHVGLGEPKWTIPRT